MWLHKCMMHYNSTIALKKNWIWFFDSKAAVQPGSSYHVYLHSGGRFVFKETEANYRNFASHQKDFHYILFGTWWNLFLVGT